MKKLCKFLFPTDNLGNTVARITEILLDSENREIYINKLGMVYILFIYFNLAIFGPCFNICIYTFFFLQEFPPEQNRLHRLQTAITLLSRFEITEIVCDE